MIDCFRAIGRTTSLRSLCSILARELKKAAGAEKCTVYLVDAGLKRMYEDDFKDVRTIGKARCADTWLYIHTEPACDFEEPMFPTLAALRKGYRTETAIIRGISLNKELYLGLQMQSPLDRPNMEFSGLDEQKVTLISELAAFKLDALLSTYKVRTELKSMSQVLQICSEIVSCRDHRGIAEKVTRLMPEYFQCAKASIAFFDAENAEFFACVPESSGSDVFTDEVSRFPSSIGLSGSLLEKGGVLVVTEMKAFRKSFHPEMDNLSEVTDIRNMMFACLPGNDQEPVGVLQLTNKMSGLTEEDKNKLLECVKLVGASVSCANTINECVSLVIQMKATVDLVVNCMEHSVLGNTEFEAVLLFNQLTAVRSRLGSWTKSKKKQLALIQA
jgi:hypothetical protein